LLDATIRRERVLIYAARPRITRRYPNGKSGEISGGEAETDEETVPFRPTRSDLHKPPGGKLQTQRQSGHRLFRYPFERREEKNKKKENGHGDGQCPLSARYHEFSPGRILAHCWGDRCQRNFKRPRYLRGYEIRTFEFYRPPLEIPSAIKRRKVETSLPPPSPSLRREGASEEILRRSKAAGPPSFLFFYPPSSPRCSATRSPPFFSLLFSLSFSLSLSLSLSLCLST